MMNPKIKVIKTEEEYEAALRHIETLMDAAPGTPEEDELKLFALLVEAYENEHYPVALPDPIEAIKFRMEQEGLTRKDLAKYLGSQSKVSEVLNRKRSLSLTMIRALHEGLGIPAEVLLQDPRRELKPKRYDYREFPFAEMFRRGYFGSFNGTLRRAKDYAEELLEELFSVFSNNVPNLVYLRKSGHDINKNALLAWQAHVLHIAMREHLPPFSPDVLSDGFFAELVRLSSYSPGPQLAREYLNKKGIHFVVSRHLPQTYLDGACFYSPDGRPVIGLTLRYDRLDNFWFTLMHELAHLRLHLHPASDVAFFDDTEHLETADSSDVTPQEKEANALARDMLIPPDVWRENAANLLRTVREAPLRAFADQLGISPAIVAGRVRWEKGDYRIFSDLVGHKKVREQFPEYEQNG